MRSMTRLIRILSEFYPVTGGSVTHTIESVKNLNDCVHRQILIAMDYGVDCSAFDKAFPAEIRRVEFAGWLEKIKTTPFPVIPLILLSYSAGIRRHLKNLLTEQDDETVINIQGTLLGAILITLMKRQHGKTPIVVTQHSANPLRISLRERLATYVALILFKLNRPSMLLILDDGMGIGEFTGIIDKHRINWTRINHAIDTELFKPTNVKQEPNFIVASTSRLDCSKRVDLSILGFARFLELNPLSKCKLVIAGDGPERANLGQLAQGLGISNKVKFIGNLDTPDMINLLNHSDAVLGTSLMSNVNLSIQEAMSCGTCVIVFDNGEMSALVRNLCQGVLVKPGDIDGIAEALKTLYSNPALRKTMGENARGRIAECRSWAARAKDEINVYEAVLRDAKTNE